jgi:predicted signal transduction protein with EAL and GGDEF domain
MATQAHARRTLETDLRKALILGELSIAYRPRVDLRTQTLAGFAASPLWNHPTRGGSSRLEFIPLAEATGCIVALGEWVLNTACAEAAHWPAPLTVALDVSSRQLEDSDRLFRAVQAALQGSGLDPGRLELAFTEASIQVREPYVLPALERLGALGVRIKLTDFQIRSSSPPRLGSFPFSAVSDLPDLGSYADAAAIVRALEGKPDMAATAGRADAVEAVPFDGVDERFQVPGYLTGQLFGASEISALLRRYDPALKKASVTG